ncbi:MAG: FliG C-terminal domain-containing protein [Candidatus Coatesbacteria bacterium]
MADQLGGGFLRLEDLMALTDKQVQLVLRDIDQADAVVGMLEMSRELRNRVLANMSERARGMIQEDWNAMKGPPDAGVALTARTKILRVANEVAAKP